MPEQSLITAKPTWARLESACALYCKTYLGAPGIVSLLNFGPKSVSALYIVPTTVICAFLDIIWLLLAIHDAKSLRSLIRKFSEPCRTTSRLKIKESWPSLQKFRATKTLTSPKFGTSWLNQIGYLWSISITVFDNLTMLSRCKVPYIAQTYELRLVIGVFHCRNLMPCVFA
jgi:hypothetical protein